MQTVNEGAQGDVSGFARVLLFSSAQPQQPLTALIFAAEHLASGLFRECIAATTAVLDATPPPVAQQRLRALELQHEAHLRQGVASATQLFGERATVELARRIASTHEALGNAQEAAAWRNRASLLEIEHSGQASVFEAAVRDPHNAVLQLRLLKLFKSQDRTPELLRHFDQVRGGLKEDSAFWRECVPLLLEVVSLRPSRESHLAYLCALDNWFRGEVDAGNVPQPDVGDVERFKKAVDAAFGVMPRNDARGLEYEARTYWHMALLHQRQLSRVSLASKLSTIQKAYRCFVRALQFLPDYENAFDETIQLACERVRGAGRQALGLVKTARDLAEVSGQIPAEQKRDFEQFVKTHEEVTEAKLLETLSSYDKMRILHDPDDTQAILHDGLWYIQYGKPQVLRSWWRLLSKNAPLPTHVADTWREMVCMDAARLAEALSSDQPLAAATPSSSYFPLDSSFFASQPLSTPMIKSVQGKGQPLADATDSNVKTRPPASAARLESRFARLEALRSQFSDPSSPGAVPAAVPASAPAASVKADVKADAKATTPMGGQRSSMKKSAFHGGGGGGTKDSDSSETSVDEFLSRQNVAKVIGFDATPAKEHAKTAASSFADATKAELPKSKTAGKKKDTMPSFDAGFDKPKQKLPEDAKAEAAGFGSGFDSKTGGGFGGWGGASGFGEATKAELPKPKGESKKKDAMPSFDAGFEKPKQKLPDDTSTKKTEPAGFGSGFDSKGEGGFGGWGGVEAGAGFGSSGFGEAVKAELPKAKGEGKKKDAMPSFDAGFEKPKQKLPEDAKTEKAEPAGFAAFAGFAGKTEGGFGGWESAGGVFEDYAKAQLPKPSPEGKKVDAPPSGAALDKPEQKPASATSKKVEAPAPSGWDFGGFGGSAAGEKWADNSSMDDKTSSGPAEWPSGGFDSTFGSGTGFGSGGGGFEGVGGSDFGTGTGFGVSADAVPSWGDLQWNSNAAEEPVGSTEEGDDRPAASALPPSTKDELRVPTFGESFGGGGGGGARKSSTEDDGGGSARGLTRVQRFEADLAEAAVRASGGSSDEAEKKRDATSVPLEDDTNEEESKKEKTLQAAAQMQKADTKEALATQAEKAKVVMQEQLEKDHAEQRVEDLKTSPPSSNTPEDMGFAPSSDAVYSFGQPSSLKFSFNLTEEAAPARSPPVVAVAAAAAAAVAAPMPDSPVAQTPPPPSKTPSTPVPDLGGMSQGELERLLQKTVTKEQMYVGFVSTYEQTLATGDTSKLIQVTKYKSLLQTQRDIKAAVQEQLLKRFGVVSDMTKEEEMLRRRYNMSDDADGPSSEQQAYAAAAVMPAKAKPQAETEKRATKKKEPAVASQKPAPASGASEGFQFGGFDFGAPTTLPAADATFPDFALAAAATAAAAAASPAPASPAKAAGGPWVCLACESENVGSASSCSVCMVTKPSAAEIAKAELLAKEKKKNEAAEAPANDNASFGGGGEFSFGGPASAWEPQAGFTFGAAEVAKEKSQGESAGAGNAFEGFSFSSSQPSASGDTSFSFGGVSAAPAAATSSPGAALGRWVCLACETEVAASASSCPVCMVPKPSAADVAKAEQRTKDRKEKEAAPANDNNASSAGFGSFSAPALPGGGFSFGAPAATPNESPAGGDFGGFSFGGADVPSAAPPAAEGAWNCAACESENSVKSQVCSVCMVPRLVEGKAPAPSFGSSWGAGDTSSGFGFGGVGFGSQAEKQATPPKEEELSQSLSASDAMGRFEDSSSPWKCLSPDCDTVNPASAKQCIMCDTLRDAKEKVKEQPKVDAAAAAAAAPEPAPEAFQMSGFEMPGFDLGVNVPTAFENFKFDFAVGKEVPKADEAEVLNEGKEVKEEEGEADDERESTSDGEGEDGGEDDDDEEGLEDNSETDDEKRAAPNEDRAHSKKASSKQQRETVAEPTSAPAAAGEQDDDSINVAPEDFGFNFGSSEANDNAAKAFEFGIGSGSSFSFEANTAAGASDFFKPVEAKMPDFGTFAAPEESKASKEEEPEPEPKPVAAKARAPPVASAPAAAAAASQQVEGRKIIKAVRRRGAAAAPEPTTAVEPPAADAASESPFPALGETPAKEQQQRARGVSPSAARKIAFDD